MHLEAHRERSRALFTRFRSAAVLLFWVAYVLTRPLAGALSDWLADDVGLGAGTVTLAAGVLAGVLVGYLTVAPRGSHALPYGRASTVAFVPATATGMLSALGHSPTFGVRD